MFTPVFSTSQVQYSFIYDALNEYIICGQTEIPAAKMKETFEELSEKLKGESGTETAGFEQQFQVKSFFYTSNEGQIFLF